MSLVQRRHKIQRCPRREPDTTAEAVPQRGERGGQRVELSYLVAAKRFSKRPGSWQVWQARLVFAASSGFSSHFCARAS